MDFLTISQEISIVEVGPRDGLQNEKAQVSSADKIIYIKKLIEAGLKEIEVTSFVHPDKIPQLKDAHDVYTGLSADLAKNQIKSPCLVPNSKGLQNAINAGVETIALFSATSDSFNKANINASVEQSKERLTEVAKRAKEQNISMRGYLSTVFGCPYEGKTSVKKLIEMCHFFKSLGVYEISLGDTIGVASPQQVQSIINDLKSEFPIDFFAGHFHDTYSMAIPNILISMENGITKFDSSSGGLGGCPYAKGASGNVATEDLVLLCERLGIKTGVDMNKLIEASAHITKVLGKTSYSKVFCAYSKQKG